MQKVFKEMDRPIRIALNYVSQPQILTQPSLVAYRNMIIKGLEYLGPKADLWSAGVVLFTMVCGHLPFEDSNTQSLYKKILNARYKFTCYLSQEI